MARYDEKTSAGRAKMLSSGDTGDRLAEVDEVLGCLVVQTVEHHEPELERDPLRHIRAGRVSAAWLHADLFDVPYLT